MEIEIEVIKKKENALLRRKEVFFKIKHEGATQRRKEVREALLKELNSNGSLVVIDKMKTMFGKKETVGYAKVYESEGRLKEIERRHIIKRNFGNGSP